ncbi:MAG: BamA/TamA family outer membrane protein [Cyanobacteria bacterium]|nr:BamA/TamA family outer membrane protein [Cyanobacteriota bacterium]
MYRYIAILLLIVLSSFRVHASPSSLTGVISEIKVTGNRLVSEKEILDVIQAYKGQALSKELIVEDLRRIFGMGYFVAQSVEAKPYQKPDGSILLEFEVEENAPVTDLIIYGANQIEEIDAYQYFSGLIAKPENARLVSDKIHELEQEYLKQGYILARVKDIDMDSSGRLKIYIDEGVITSIDFNGNHKTQSEYLHLLMTNTKLNEPYNERKFGKDYKKIQGTNYFDDLNRVVKPNIDQEGYELVLQIKEKAKFSSFGLGGGVNSSAGLFGNVNYTKGNVKGMGETINVTALIGSGFAAGSTLNTNSNFVKRGKYTSISGTYTTPFYHGHDFSFTRNLSYNKGPNFTVDLTEQTMTSAGATISKSLDDNQNLSFGSSFNLIDITDRERADYINMVTDNIMEIDRPSNQDLLNASPKQFINGKRSIAKAEAREIRDEQIVSGSFLDFRSSYLYQNLDDNNKPRSGTRFRTAVMPTLGLGDIDSYTKLSTSASRFFPMPMRSTLLLNLRGGYDLFGDIPQFSKYRLGTSSGVRGYRPISELGVGSKMLLSTAEFRTPIYNILPNLKNSKLFKNLDFALFADAGLVGGDVRLNRLTERLSQAASVGFGLRINIPLFGALRFDVGFPIIEALTDSTKLFRLNFGPATFI